MRMAEQTQVEIKDKFCLTIDEASAYFNIGEKKLSRIVTDNIDERANVKTDGMRSNIPSTVPKVLGHSYKIPVSLLHI